MFCILQVPRPLDSSNSNAKISSFNKDSETRKFGIDESEERSKVLAPPIFTLFPTTTTTTTAANCQSSNNNEGENSCLMDQPLKDAISNAVERAIALGSPRKSLEMGEILIFA